MYAQIRLRCLVPCAALLGAAVAHSQPLEDTDLLLAQASFEAPLLVAGDDTVAFAARELGDERIVKGAPYCAEAEIESVQPLTDGNRIVRRHTTRLCRDGEGRTRQEIDRGGRKTVYLRDPVAHESWVLDPERKSARRLSAAGPLLEREHGFAMREYADKMRDWARNFRESLRREPGTPVVAPVPPTPPVPPPVPAIVGEDDMPKGMQMHVLRMDPQAPLPPLPPGVAFQARVGAPRGPGVATALGSKDIDGVRANGERTTWTIEAGKLGNEKPIVITRDVWTSPELLLTLQSRDADPRVGETTYRLARLKRGEPDAALMRVPPDYAAPPAPGPRGAKG
ncbi:hypothetical protein [Piscinibacter sp. XHJ-5]|uniref:hypothetical protein n=1 Tax=Piscinibacter sp. XHJ-5 TaxID=3037797 RepID=UPI002453628F|nr:hypothetical protein [Piscinibacter sp. XHJ-5]